MPATRSRSSSFRNVALFISALVLGLPMALVFTHGTILVPLVVVAILTPFVALHYLLWGWWLSPQRKHETPQTVASIDRTHFTPTRPADGIRRQEQGESYFR
jgi:Na+/alanine symporter